MYYDRGSTNSIATNWCRAICAKYFPKGLAALSLKSSLAYKSPLRKSALYSKVMDFKRVCDLQVFERELCEYSSEVRDKGVNLDLQSFCNRESRARDSRETATAARYKKQLTIQKDGQ